MDRSKGDEPVSDQKTAPGRRRGALQEIPVGRIRPEDGLGRRRDRDGHRELCRSIEQFGVLTPITVRRSPDGSGDYLLIKGQGRTLACRVLGLDTIPAIVVDDKSAEAEKVQQFLVENVARLRLSPVDRALLIARARRDGEETAEVARRFGVHPQTVRRLQAQLEGVSSGEMAALRGGKVNLGLHAVIARHIHPEERAEVIDAVVQHGTKAADLDALLTGLGWRALSQLDGCSSARLALLRWALQALARLPRGRPRNRICALAEILPPDLRAAAATEGAA